jgi:general secretion pathway protein B
VSFILDALRKSEHERQRSTVPGLSHVPYATPARALPRWVLALIALLAVSVFALAGAWWLSSRPTPTLSAALPASVERPVERPPAAAPLADRAVGTPSRALAEAANAGAREPAPAEATVAGPAASVAAPEPAPPRASEPTLPSVAALLAEGIALPALRLELHAYSERPSDRFVFINGRKYVEGERLAEGPDLVSIAPTGAVLSLQGRRFLLTPQ